MKRFTITAILITLWVYPVFAEETIYSWKDKNGIDHFGNQPPPEDVQHFKETKVIPDGSTSGEPTDTLRPEYNEMVENAAAELQQNEIETKQKEIERAIQEKQKAEDDKKAKIDAKRKELQDQIEYLKKHPFGRNIVNNPNLGNESRKSRGFNMAARNAQIADIQKQIDELDKQQ
ncbi:DUF4124 domain-containing protein [Desulfobacterium sp. N47]|uniref:DUF4124 domain-containing protein n=1 Tax=uncultured Desulfobacterium sp. TaxID=201089 RepID=E1YKM0_9BACT|nr:unknown protein [uncultured Desulfobacterium sp.]